MNGNFYMATPSGTVFDLPDNHPEKVAAINERKAQARNLDAQNYLMINAYALTPYEQQLALMDERYRRQLMLQRDREDSRRRRLLEQQAYSTIGSIGSAAGREFVKSLF